MRWEEMKISIKMLKRKGEGITARRRRKIRRISRKTNEIKCVGFEVFTAVTMKNAAFWDVVPCGSCENPRFGGTCHFHLQGGGTNCCLLATF
jgi:hypothetical protein